MVIVVDPKFIKKIEKLPYLLKKELSDICQYYTSETDTQVFEKFKKDGII